MSQQQQPRPELLAQLSQAAGKAHQQLRAEVAATTALGDQPPTPGDLWVVPDPDQASGEHHGELLGAVEWAVLGNDGRGRLHMVPVDASPMLGTADVVAADQRVLRCGSDLWLEPSALAGAQRTGVLATEILTAAQERCRALPTAVGRSSLRALETIEIRSIASSWLDSSEPSSS